MRKPQLNFLIDSIAFVGFILLVSTGFLMHFTIPPGQGHGLTIWGLGRHDCGTIHFWIAAGFLATLSLHLILHWQWILTMVRGRKRSETNTKIRVGLGLVAVSALVIFAIAPILSPVQVSEETEEPPHSARSSSDHIEPAVPTIRGSMTLDEVEQQTGVPATHILQKLDLPPDTPTDVILRDLHNSLDFTMEEVRQIVAEYESLE